MSELDGWSLAVSFTDLEEMFGSTEQVMVGSGAAVSVCPLGYKLVPISNHSKRATLRTASSAQIEFASQKMVEYENSDGGLVNFNFEVSDVTRPLVAVGELKTWNDCSDESTWMLRDSRSSDETAWQQTGYGASQ